MLFVACFTKGIEQIKNLEFDELREEEQATVKTPVLSTTDPWGMSTTAASAGPLPASSSLSDLEQLQTPSSNPLGVMGSFGGMAMFPGTPVPSVGITAGGSPFGLVQPGVLPLQGQQVFEFYWGSWKEI